MEALGIRILDRPAGLDEPQGDAALMRPLIQGLAGELGAVIADQTLREAARGGQPVEHVGDAGPRERVIDFEGGTLAGEVIHDGQRPEAAPIGQWIRPSARLR